MVAAAAAGTGEVQKRPEGWVLPNETLPAVVVVRSCPRHCPQRDPSPGSVIIPRTPVFLV